MTNPFENDSAHYLVLINDEGQHSVWPDNMDIPAGWSRRFGPDNRAQCLDYVEKHWTDLRPASLVTQVKT